MHSASGRIDPAAWLSLAGIAAFIGFLFLLPEPADSERAGSITPDTGFAKRARNVPDDTAGALITHRSVYM